VTPIDIDHLIETWKQPIEPVDADELAALDALLDERNPMTTADSLLRTLITAFAELVAIQSRLVESEHGTRIEWCEKIQTRVEYGPKWARIDRTLTNGQWCGYLMVDLLTQEIVGIKGYGRPHHGHQHGTLLTVREWTWGGNYPVRKSKMTDDEAAAFVVDKMNDADAEEAEEERREASVRLGWETIHEAVKS
jgi:hypothetical protein